MKYLHMSGRDNFPVLYEKNRLSAVGTLQFCHEEKSLYSNLLLREKT